MDLSCCPAEVTLSLRKRREGSQEGRGTRSLRMSWTVAGGSTILCGMEKGDAHLPLRWN